MWDVVCLVAIPAFLYPNVLNPSCCRSAHMTRTLPGQPQEQSRSVGNWFLILATLITASATIVVGYWQFHATRRSVEKLSLSGQVFDADNAGIENAKLTLVPASGTPITKHSREQGAFEFDNIPSRTGNLTVSANGYATVTRDITPGQPMEIELTSKPSDRGGPNFKRQQAGDTAQPQFTLPSSQAQSLSKVYVGRSRDLQANAISLDGNQITASSIASDYLDHTILQLTPGPHTLSVPKAVKPCSKSFNVPTTEQIWLTCVMPFERSSDGK
jgi:hypothetical protein